MKVTVSKIILVFFLLFIGSTDVKAVYNGDCLLDVFISEIVENDSEELFGYLYLKSEEETKRIYEAWKVLYEADKSVDRLEVSNLIELIDYMKHYEKEGGLVVKEIQDVGGYLDFKKTPSWLLYAKNIHKVIEEPWMEGFPHQLILDLSDKISDIYILFKFSDSNRREKLFKTWEFLKRNDMEATELDVLVLVSRMSDMFVYKNKEGFSALDIAFEELIKYTFQKNELIDEFQELSDMFNSEMLIKDSNLPIKFSCIDGESVIFSPIVLDGVGDEVIGVYEGVIIKNKFFNKVDATYEKIGEYKGNDIFRKGKEVGFKSADVINIKN